MAYIETTPRISTQVINRYLRIKVEPIYRKSKLLGMLRAKKRILFNQDGDGIVWFPRFVKRDITASDGATVDIAFPKTATRKKATLPWRSYNLGESVGKYERLVGQNSDVAIFKVYQDALDQLTSDFTDAFALKLYTDGGATGSKELMGFETWLASTGSLITSGVVADPSDTYAGLSTLLGNYGGSWSADTSNSWPTGTGDSEYCAWSPILVDYNATGLGASTTNWTNQWQRAMRFANAYMETVQNRTIDAFCINTKLLNDAKASLEADQQIEVTQQSEMTKLGFRTLQFEGIELFSEYGVPDAVGYGIIWDSLTLRSMQGQLVAIEKDKDIRSADDLLAADFWGNLQIETPAWMAKLLAITTAGT
jgi:hypothetical protein